MIELQQPFENQKELKVSALEKNQDEKSTSKQQKRIITLAFICALIIFAVFIMIIFLVIKKHKSKDDKLQNYGEIKCLYNIIDVNNPIYLINPNYINTQKISILLDENNNTIPYRTSYKFKTKGNHSIIFILNEKKLEMNYMFKNISSLISVEMISENISLNNIEGAFENCNNLEYLKIKGFNIDNLKSLKKLFYNTSKITKVDLSEFDTSKIEDFSFMFANTNIKEINNLNFNSNNAKNLSYMFCNCTLLTSINLLNFETKNVIDMSHMFENN